MRQSKILITGAKGQLGRALHVVLAPLGEVKAYGRSALNLLNDSDVAQICLDFRPDWIVNAAAYTAVDRAEDDVETAFAVNRDAIRRLTKYANGARVIHFSTDYVFDGALDRAYDEDDAVNPLSVYGKSKLAGEIVVAQSNVEYLIFRTSWLFSVWGQNFAHTMKKLGEQGQALSVVNDQVGAPTSVEFLAQIAATVIVRYSFSDQIPCGIYHATCTGSTSWFGYADYLFSVLGDTEARAKLSGIPSTSYPQRAFRPLNSRLSNRKLITTFGVNPPPWQFYVERWAQTVKPR